MAMHYLNPDRRVNNSVIVVSPVPGSSYVYNRGVYANKAGSLIGDLDLRYTNDPRYVTVFSSGVTSAHTTYTSELQRQLNRKGLKVFFDVISMPSGTVSFQLQHRDDNTGKFVDIPNASMLLSSPGADVLTMYPGLNSGVKTVNNVVPTTWRAQATVGNTVTAVFQMNAEYLD